jgi:hypothetical protein
MIEENVQRPTSNAQRPKSEWWTLSFEERMAHRAARRATPEYQERIEARKRFFRLREIWAAAL